MDTIYNRDGCFYRALDDEPVFVLLARDPCFAEAVRWWVTLRQALIGRGEKPLEDHSVLADAMATAAAGVVWRSDATGPEWLEGPRWHVEKPPERELVEAAKLAVMRDRLLANANRFYGYAANHFAKDSEESWRKGEVNWSEYLANIELLGLEPADKPTGGSKVAAEHFAARETISEAQRHTVEAIKSCLPEPTEAEIIKALNDKPGLRDSILARLDTNPPWYAETIRRAIALGTEGRANRIVEKKLLDFKDDNSLVTFHKSTLLAALKAAASDPVKVSLQMDTAPIRTALAVVADKLEEWCGDKVSERADEGRRLAKDIRQQATKVYPMPFIAYDLAAKVSVGLRQVSGDLQPFLERHFPDDSATMSFVDRINGYAAELADGRWVADQLRTRTVGKSPLLGEPYTPSPLKPAGDIYENFTSAIGYDPSRDSPAAILEAIGKTLGISYEDMAADYRRAHGLPDPVPPGVYYGIEGSNFYDLVTNRGMGNDFYAKWRHRVSEFPSKVHDEFAIPAGYPHDWLGSTKAPSDTIDVTDTPEMPPHRFTIFTKAKGWAYGRGLEISPAHIPAMLDRMAEDGWHLQCVFGGVVADKVGMLFRRHQFSAFEIAHGYGGGFQTVEQARAEESDGMRAWKAGEPFTDTQRYQKD